MKTTLLVTLCLTLTIFGTSFAQETGARQQESDSVTADQNVDRSEKDKAVDRTRRQVKMLDDIYKGGIVLITTHYVEGDEDLPAGTAFKKLFEAAAEKGWHEVRLVDATGEPYNDENVAVSDFEKRAIKQLQSGKPFIDETVIEDEKRYFLAATPIPVVMEKCTMCHSNYDMDIEGQIVGALTYRVPIDE